MKGRADRPNAGRVSVKMAYVNTANLNMFKINMSIRHMSGRGGQLGPGVADAGPARGPDEQGTCGRGLARPDGHGICGRGPTRPDGHGDAFGRDFTRPHGRRPTTTNFTWSCWLRSFRIAARLDLPMPGVARIRFPAGRVSARHR